MIYKEFKGDKLSALGFGLMRLPGAKVGVAGVDKEATREMFDYAFEHGINYFDTAWAYHGGESETVAGEILSEHPRDSFYLADKFPGYDTSNFPKAQEIFEQQLAKDNVDYFDYYLLHNVNESNIDYYLDPQYRIKEIFTEEQKNGRIRHFGFSCHGRANVLMRFLAEYGEVMEFCQLQLNYLDWDFQECSKKVDILSSYGIPVWVMEPLRGGKLVNLKPEHEARLKALRPDEDIINWAFRFCQSVPEVVVTLSGMSSLDQMKQNVAIFEEDKPLTDIEKDELLAIANEMTQEGTVPCTGCAYCTSYCPIELNIPYLISLYNEHSYSGGGFMAPMALSVVPEDKQPSACLGCGSCAQVCPQQIPIPDIMADFVEKLG
jgi:predicted aldo/keto reductase-like oxidoreductase